MDQQIDIHIESLAPDKAAIAQKLRAIVLSAVPGIREAYKYKCPFFYFHGPMCYIGTKKHCVYLGFIDGHLMTDETHALEGLELKQVRHLEFSSIRNVDITLIADFLNQAVFLKELKAKGIKSVI